MTILLFLASLSAGPAALPAPAGEQTARTAIVRYMGQRGAGAPDEPLFLGRRGALDWRGRQQVLKRLKGRAGIHRAMQPALAPPHLRPELPRQRR